MDNSGHRQRLKKRFIQTGLGSLLDYERLELLLTYIIPRKDCKALAKTLILQFKTFDGVLNASEESLLAINGIGNETVTFFKFLKSLFLSDFNQSNRVLNSVYFNDVLLFLRQKTDYSIENFHLLLFDENNILISHQRFESNSKHKVSLDIKLLMEYVIRFKAYSVIIAHNHFMSTNPSQSDSNVTRKFKNACDLIQVILLDHIIFTKDDSFSYAQEKLL